jgi:hypothetical protein
MLPFRRKISPSTKAGAAPNRFMVHLALNEVDDEHPAVHWGEHVTDEEYAQTPTAD